MSLEIKNININIGKKNIVKNFSLTVNPGEVHVIMGKNGSGKSTLANTLMGYPGNEITSGKVLIDSVLINDMSPDERSRHGLFLSMQYLPEIAGVTIQNLLRTAYNNLNAKKLNPIEFNKYLKNKMDLLDMNYDFANRHLNVGFSGGEKKKSEILQLLVLDPKYVILDETDSGLDVDSLKSVSIGINKFINKNKSVILITHYNKILEYVKPDYVHVMDQGIIIKSGGKELAEKIEKHGFTDLN